MLGILKIIWGLLVQDLYKFSSVWTLESSYPIFRHLEIPEIIIRSETISSVVNILEYGLLVAQ